MVLRFFKHVASFVMSALIPSQEYTPGMYHYPLSVWFTSNSAALLHRQQWRDTRELI